MARKVLLVEDTAALRESIADLLKMEGFAIDGCRNGREAVARLEKERPDLIITDLLMPEMDGFELIKWVRDRRECDAVAILVYSAMPPHESEKSVLGLGATSYLKKPSTADTLVELVNKLIDHE